MVFQKQRRLSGKEENVKILISNSCSELSAITFETD